MCVCVYKCIVHWVRCISEWCSNKEDRGEHGCNIHLDKDLLSTPEITMSVNRQVHQKEQNSPASFHGFSLRQKVDILSKKISSEDVMVEVAWLCACSCRADLVSWDRCNSQLNPRGL